MGSASSNLKVPSAKCLRRAKTPSRERFNTTRLSCHSSPSSLDRQEVRMHPTTRGAIMKEFTETKIRVNVFEMVKQYSNSAMKNITILSVAPKGGGEEGIR